MKILICFYKNWSIYILFIYYNLFIYYLLTINIYYI